MQAAIDIKVLQTLGLARETRSPARVETGEGPRPTVNGDDFLVVPGARGPVLRALNRCGKRPQPRDLGCLLLRPVHGEGQALALR